MHTCAACSAFCDEATLLQQARSKGILDDVQSHPVFHTAARIQKFSLGDDLHHQSGEYALGTDMYRPLHMCGVAAQTCLSKV